jgi:hypothetical protein
MSRLILACLLLFIGFRASLEAAENYDLAFSTFYGGSGWEHARDIVADKDGNIYVVGGTGPNGGGTNTANNFPATIGSFNNSSPTGGLGAFGRCDVFVLKFNASGQLLWSKLVGGPNYDRAYAAAMAPDGNLIVSGRAGQDFPTTAGVVQPAFGGPGGSSGSGNYGTQNGFLMKIAPDGTTLWSTYIGCGNLVRNFHVDTDGDIYVPLVRIPSSPALDSDFANALTGSYKPSPGGGIESGVAKLNGSATQVYWATWLGGSADDSQETVLRADTQDNVYVLFNTTSNDIPTSSTVTPVNTAPRDSTYNGGGDLFLAVLNNTGSQLIYGTYIGGSGNDGTETHGLAIDGQGNAYVSGHTDSDNFPTTPGVLRTTRAGAGDIPLAKISPTAGLLLGTYIGGTAGDSSDGIWVDDAGRVYISAQSASTNFPVTANAWQATNKGSSDAVLVLLSADFSQMEYCTYLGGTGFDYGRCGFLGKDGALYISGSTDGASFPTLRAHQAAYVGGGHPFTTSAGDLIIAKMVRKGDADGDGASNFDEFINGTDSLSGLSFFHPGGNLAGSYDVAIPARKGRVYVLERTTDFLGWNEIARSATMLQDQALTLRDLNPLPDFAFYHIGTVFP